MNKEQLMEKVKKLLALAGNNPNENEAKAAMLKAQKLISEYNLDMNEMGDKDKIVILPATHPNNNGYRTKLAVILAENFRCKAIMCGNIVNFIGYEADARVCVEVFNYAYKVSRSAAQKIERQYRKEGRSIHGVANSYWNGFCAGIKEVLDEQCRALMIVVPQEVEQKLNKISSGKSYGGGSRYTGFDSEAYIGGKKDGRAHMRSRQLEG